MDKFLEIVRKFLNGFGIPMVDRTTAILLAVVAGLGVLFLIFSIATIIAAAVKRKGAEKEVAHTGCPFADGTVAFPQGATNVNYYVSGATAAPSNEQLNAVLGALLSDPDALEKLKERREEKQAEESVTEVSYETKQPGSVGAPILEETTQEETTEVQKQENEIAMRYAMKRERKARRFAKKRAVAMEPDSALLPRVPDGISNFYTRYPVVAVGENESAAEQPTGVSYIGDNMMLSGGIFVRYRLSFKARIIEAKPEMQAYYNAVMQRLSAYKKIKATESFKQVRVSAGRKRIALMFFRGQTLCVAFPLNPADYADSKYKFEDMSDVKRLEETPFMMRLTSDRKLAHTLELIDIVAASYELKKGEETEVTDSYPVMTRNELVEKGLAKIETNAKTEEELAAAHFSITANMRESIVYGVEASLPGAGTETEEVAATDSSNGSSTVSGNGKVYATAHTGNKYIDARNVRFGAMLEKTLPIRAELVEAWKIDCEKKNLLPGVRKQAENDLGAAEKEKAISLKANAERSKKSVKAYKAEEAKRVSSIRKAARRKKEKELSRKRVTLFIEEAGKKLFESNAAAEAAYKARRQDIADYVKAAETESYEAHKAFVRLAGEAEKQFAAFLSGLNGELKDLRAEEREACDKSLKEFMETHDRKVSAAIDEFNGVRAAAAKVTNDAAVEYTAAWQNWRRYLAADKETKKTDRYKVTLKALKEVNREKRELCRQAIKDGKVAEKIAEKHKEKEILGFNQEKEAFEKEYLKELQVIAVADKYIADRISRREAECEQLMYGRRASDYKEVFDAALQEIAEAESVKETVITEDRGFVYEAKDQSLEVQTSETEKLRRKETEKLMARKAMHEAEVEVAKKDSALRHNAKENVAAIKSLQRKAEALEKIERNEKTALETEISEYKGDYGKAMKEIEVERAKTAKAQAKIKAEAEAKAQAQAKAEANAKAAAEKAKADAEKKAKAEAQAQAKAAANAKAAEEKARLAAKKKAELDAKAKNKAEANAKAAAEKAKADAEKKAKAEAQAQAKAAANAKAAEEKAKLAAKKKAELDAKAKAKAEAQAKAAAEKAKADAEKKVKAEREANIKAAEKANLAAAKQAALDAKLKAKEKAKAEKKAKAEAQAKAKAEEKAKAEAEKKAREEQKSSEKKK